MCVETGRRDERKSGREVCLLPLLNHNSESTRFENTERERESWVRIFFLGYSRESTQQVPITQDRQLPIPGRKDFPSLACIILFSRTKITDNVSLATTGKSSTRVKNKQPHNDRLLTRLGYVTTIGY